jgi:hypothetical protein
MIKKLCSPYKGCNPMQITQGFIPKQHEAVDFASSYGTFLVAPERIIIERIKAGIDWNNPKEIEQGYGIVFTSIDKTRRYSYWHCLPVFSTDEGLIIEQGQPVAQMGNSGWVFSGGKYVPLEERNKPPHYGTHLHLSFSENGINKNIIEYIDWEIEIKYNLLTAIKNIIQKMANLLKGRA